MAKIITDKNIKEIKKSLKENKITIGTNECLKALRNNTTKKVFLTSNCSEKVEKDINHYAKLIGAEVIKISQKNEELGTICKKPFGISVLCL